MNLQTIKAKITPVLKNENIVKAAVFGSQVSGDVKRSSDIDLLIEFSGRKSLFDLVGLKIKLEKILKKRLIC